MRSKNLMIKVALLVSLTTIGLSPGIALAVPARPLVKAQALQEQGQVREALAILNAIICKEPNNAQAYSERGLAHGALEQNDLALADCSKAISLAPKLAIAYANRARIFILLSRYNDALKDSNKALALKPNLAEAYAAKGRAYDHFGDYQKELEYCNKAIALNSQSARYYCYRARAFRQLDQYQRALEDANRSIKLDSKRAGPYMERGFIYFCQNKFQKAFEDYTVAVKITPLSVDPLLLRAEVLSKLGQYQNQIADLTAATKINAKLARAYEQRGYTYYRLGQLQNAIDDFNTALQLSPASLNAHSNASFAHEEFELYQKAIEHRSRAIELEPKYAYHRSIRARLYERLGKHNLAKADRLQAMKVGDDKDKLHLQSCSPLIDFINPASESPKDSIDKQLKIKSVVLPFHYDNGDHICLPVQANGHSLQLMLDTGCGHSDLWNKAMPGVAKLDKTQQTNTRANGKEYSYGFCRLGTLALDHLILSNVAMSVNEGLTGHDTLSGFLGGNILENMVVTIDYIRKQVILSAERESPPNDAIIVPIWIRSHRLFCNVRLDGKLDMSAMLDTGCPNSMSADALLKPILPKKMEFNNRIEGPWLGKLSCESVRLNNLELGGSSFKPPLFDVYPAAQAPDAASEIILGNDFLSQFKIVTFDYPARRMILIPNEANTNIAAKLYREGRNYLSRHEEQLAIDAFTKVMALDSEFATRCYLHRGEAFVHLQEYTKAVADFSALIKLEPKNHKHYLSRAWANTFLKQYKMQIADDTTAIGMNPNSQWAYENRAWAYEQLGQHGLAQNDFKMAKKLAH